MSLFELQAINLHQREQASPKEVYLLDPKSADNFYAWRCLKSLGIDTADGVVRISLTHYNNMDEVEKLISCIDKIN